MSPNGRADASDDARAARYHALQLRLAVAGLGAGGAWLLALLTTGVADAVAAAGTRVLDAWWWRVAAVAAATAAGHALLTLPFAWTRGWWLPRRFGLSHQGLGGWLGDRLKASLVAAALGLAALEALYALLRATDLWWLAAAPMFFVAYALLATVFPVWILPLFYRLTPLADAGLADRLLDLARRAGVSAVGVWVADQSRKGRTANALLVGLGRTRRIILFDTLTASFEPEEIETVLAHELAHHVHGDVRRSLLAQGVLTLASFAAADLALRAGVGWWGLAGLADPAGLPWLVLVLGALALVLAPLGNAFSRRLERQADDFALALTANPAAFVAAMERLAGLNLAERRPHRLKEMMLYSHPSLERRIARARGASA